MSLSFFIYSCNATKYLDEGDKFTGKNRIILESPEKIDKKSILKQELSLLYKQKRNSNRGNVWIYYRNMDPGDTLWYNSFVKRFFAEKPSIFNKNLVELSAREMQDFLRNKRGFYHATVDYKLFSEEDETGVDYIIDCGKRYRINSVSFNCEDSLINTLIQHEKNASLLKVGDPVSSLNYELEKKRIGSLLQNNGYAQFFSNYIELTGDSSNYKIDLLVNIYNPDELNNHKKYEVGEINVFTDYHPNQSDTLTKKDTLDGIIFHRELNKYFVDPGLIGSMIALKKGDLSSRKKKQDSYNRLSLLNPYKFIAIKQEVNEFEKNKIDYNVLLIPKKSKWFWDNGIQLNYSTADQFTQLFGFGLNFSLQNDNLFNEAVRFVSNLNADTDIHFVQLKPQEFILQNSNTLYFPKPVNLHKYSILKPIFSTLNKKQYDRFLNYGATKLTLGANYFSIDSSITILSGNASLGYQYNPSEREAVYINQISVDYYYPTIVDSSKFPGIFFKNSLSPRLVTGFLFQDIAYSYSSKKIFKQFSWQIFTGLEFSGLEISLANYLYNVATGNEDPWVINQNETIKFAKYAKTYFEWRGHLKTGNTSNLASRFFFGLGIPYGDNDVLPYSKQFYVGGPQSIRAWEKRGLGPGGFFDPNFDPEETAYQKGDIKLEANIEYRFDLPWYFEGAVFVDAGNIWTFNDDEKIEDENFTLDFYKQLGIGAGMGLRINFNFLLIRFDLGYKIRTPYLDPDSQKHWQITHTNYLRDGYLSFGLDYPF